ncbi:predicted protein [Botrytis cinerea T4]|uniref:Uncharacterized protein n=1 Tax=Botryotinia fuckeliana (strain T4) TaxID=999810 RepID=G2Y4P0_BOTF4|nr:predicted protein [Botrytis cinerea T4]
MKRESRRRERHTCFIKLLGLACKNLYKLQSKLGQFEASAAGKDIQKMGHNMR